MKNWLKNILKRWSQRRAAVQSSELLAALEEAEKLIEDGWANAGYDTPAIYRHGVENSARPIEDMRVWMMMRAITRGIGMKSKWDREAANNALHALRDTSLTL